MFAVLSFMRHSACGAQCMHVLHVRGASMADMPAEIALRLFLSLQM